MLLDFWKLWLWSSILRQWQLHFHLQCGCTMWTLVLTLPTYAAIAEQSQSMHRRGSSHALSTCAVASTAS